MIELVNVDHRWQVSVRFLFHNQQRPFGRSFQPYRPCIDPGTCRDGNQSERTAASIEMLFMILLLQNTSPCVAVVRTRHLPARVDLMKVLWSSNLFARRSVPLFAICFTNSGVDVCLAKLTPIFMTAKNGITISVAVLHKTFIMLICIPVHATIRIVLDGKRNAKSTWRRLKKRSFLLWLHYCSNTGNGARWINDSPQNKGCFPPLIAKNAKQSGGEKRLKTLTLMKVFLATRSKSKSEIKSIEYGQLVPSFMM
jgi:hypothetical protein